MQWWISKRDTSIDTHTHPPLPWSSLAPSSDYVELPHSQTERHERTSGKTGSKWNQGRRSRGCDSSVKGAKLHTSSRGSNKMLDKRRKTYSKVGQRRRLWGCRAVSLSIILYGYTEEKHRRKKRKEAQGHDGGSQGRIQSRQPPDPLYLHNRPSPGSGAAVMVDVISSSLAVLPLLPSRGQARGGQGVSGRWGRLAECRERAKQRQLISTYWYARGYEEGNFSFKVC